VILGVERGKRRRGGGRRGGGGGGVGRVNPFCQSSISSSSC